MQKKLRNLSPILICRKNRRSDEIEYWKKAAPNDYDSSGRKTDWRGIGGAEWIASGVPPSIGVEGFDRHNAMNFLGEK
jgi:hypothetical protein